MTQIRGKQITGKQTSLLRLPLQDGENQGEEVAWLGIPPPLSHSFLEGALGLGLKGDKV